MKTTGYEPLFVPKPVDDDIWIVDGPNISFYKMPFPTRMTLIRLENGDLFVHSPIEFNEKLQKAVDALGTVRHLVAPNWIHYAYLPQWQEAYPEAQTWVAPGVAERAEKYDVHITIDGQLGGAAREPWRGQVRQRLVEGHPIHQEAVFFHVASKTLILTDLIENFEMEHTPLWARPLIKLAGISDPDGKTPVDMRLGFRFGNGGEGLENLRRILQEIYEWEPERVIIAHGRWYDSDGLAELKRAFRWV